MLGDNIKKLRIEKGLTQEELGKVLNKTKNNISQYETGKREPDNDTLSKLSDLFSVSVDYLLGRTDDLKPPAEDWQPELTQKDEKDIEKLLNDTMNALDNTNGLMLQGEIVDEEDLELLKMAIRNGLEYAKISNKKKYTPKKFRK